MKLSIIIPVYNAAKSIGRCLKSVVRQLTFDAEIIVVDDGSADQSFNIAEDFSGNFPNIRIIRQGNKGLSGARNTGLDLATGDYITFVDSDDRIENNTYPQLINLLESNRRIDLLEFPIYERYGNAKRQHKRAFEKLEYTVAEDYWFRSKAYEHCYMCNKIFRRDLFGDVRFPENHVFEDVFALPEILKLRPVIVTTDLGLYYYMWNQEGITATAKGEELSDLLRAHLLVYNDLKARKVNVGKADLAGYYAYLLNIQMDVYELTGKAPILPKEDFDDTFKLRIMQMIGMKNICRLNKTLHRLLK